MASPIVYDMKTGKGFSDSNIETAMGNLLRVGVLLSAMVVLIGGAIYFIHHGHEMPSFSHFSGEPARFTHPALILKYALKGSGRAIIQLGLMILIATPVARVFFSVFGFIKEKDVLYTGITLFVLGVIIVSLS